MNNKRRLVEETDLVAVFETAARAEEVAERFGGEAVRAWHWCRCGACDPEENPGVLFQSEAACMTALQTLDKEAGE